MAIYDPIRGGEIYQGHGNERHKEFTKQKELKAANPNAECTTCESCVTVCPTHIDIRKGMQLECINCLECVDACTQVMGALGKPSLVQWSSVVETERHERKTKIFRPKVIAYFTILAIVLFALFAMGSTKEHMLLNINKTTRLYKILDNGEVENDYVFLFANTDSKRHTYFFEIEGDLKDKIRIVRPKEPFAIAPGKKRKKVVVLRTKEKLADNTRKDVPIPVTIKAFAVDDKEKVAVTRHTVFVYPRADLLKK
jgi:cytochrome c oxidase accessory protein FixG